MRVLVLILCLLAAPATAQGLPSPPPQVTPPATVVSAPAALVVTPAELALAIEALKNEAHSGNLINSQQIQANREIAERDIGAIRDQLMAEVHAAKQSLLGVHDILQATLDEHAKAIVLARENAAQALGQALDRQEKSLNAALITTNQAGDKQQKDNKDRADALASVVDRLSGLVASLPSRQELDTRSKAADDRFNDRVRIEDQGLVELRGSLQAVANSIRDIQGEANGRNSLWQLMLGAVVVIGGVIGIVVAFRNRPPQVIYANANGNGYPPPPRAT